MNDYCKLKVGERQHPHCVVCDAALSPVDSGGNVLGAWVCVNRGCQQRLPTRIYERVGGFAEPSRSATSDYSRDAGQEGHRPAACSLWGGLMGRFVVASINCDECVGDFHTTSRVVDPCCEWPSEQKNIDPALDALSDAAREAGWLLRNGVIKCPGCLNRKVCPNCDLTIQPDKRWWNFCPRCGRRYRKEGD